MNPSPLLAIPSERESLVGVVCSLLLLARLLLRVCLSLLPFFRTIHFLPSCASSSFQNKKFMTIDFTENAEWKDYPYFYPTQDPPQKKKETKTRDKKKVSFLLLPIEVFRIFGWILARLPPISCLLSPASYFNFVILKLSSTMKDSWRWFLVLARERESWVVQEGGGMGQLSDLRMGLECWNWVLYSKEK